jgi:hypothetical protein
MSRHEPPLTPHEQYLWDRAGTPDPTTVKIEESLRPLRFTGQLRVPAKPARPFLRPLALAAAVILIGLGAWMSLRHQGGSPPPPALTPTWTLASSVGKVHISDAVAVKSTATERTLSTDESGRAVLACGEHSTVNVESNTRMRFVDGDPLHPWVSLASGSLFTQVSAKDRPVLVGVLGGSIAVRPGAAASISVDEQSGSAHTTCKRGELHIAWSDRQTRVLGPATCAITRDLGPALPLPASMSPAACGVVEELTNLLAYGAKSPKQADDMLRTFLAGATREQAPLLWNLLWRVEGDQRRAVRDRLAFLIKQPKMHPDAVLKLDPAAMDAWWQACVEAASGR